MGFRYFSSGGSYDSSRVNPSQPDPFNFKVEREIAKQDYVLAWVNYPDAHNFEGNKIILIKGLKTTKHLKSLDPHFLEEGDFKVMARFRPNEIGWECGEYMLKALTSK